VWANSVVEFGERIVKYWRYIPRQRWM